MEQEFIQNHWKGKLIKQSAAHITLVDVELSEKTRLLLKNLGLPIILPNENKISFLPFTYLLRTQIRDKHFYIIGDFSSGLSGVTLLSIEIQTEQLYLIFRNLNNERFYYFINQSLEQFLICLAHFNIYQEGENTRIEEQRKPNLYDAKTVYNRLTNMLKQVDKKAFEDKGSYWNQVLFGIQLEVESLENDERETYSQSNDKEFPRITRDDLPF